MKFATKEDLEVPIDAVFSMLTDFEAFERAAMRHGADVAREDPNAVTGVGMSWQVKATLRGKRRSFKVTMTEYDPPHQMVFDAASDAIKSQFLVELVALSRNRTRMRSELDVRPKTLAARLLLQSAKLARNTLSRRFKTRVAHFAEDLEDRYKRSLKQTS